jgi:cytochrome c oxidase subunit 4
MADQHAHTEHSGSSATYYIVFAILMVLLLATVLVAYVPLGEFNVIVALTIALIKAALVILYFMHVKHSSKLIWVFAAAGFFWLILLFGITMTDYLTRSWVIQPHGM